MSILKKILKWLIGSVIVIYFLVCGVLYFEQEKIIFHPSKLSQDYKFHFNTPFEEISIITKDDNELNAVLFKADSSKGVIFYLHGNTGALDTWGGIAKNYTALHYDVFILDYRGFGKSEGEINSEAQFYNDVQAAYDALKERYKENKIIIMGYSIGTGPAAMLAARNHPKLLILEAPYCSMADMTHHIYPFVPTLLLKYKFATENFINVIRIPIVIFHGDEDEVIYYGSSLKLKEFFKPGDTLITLAGQGHNGITDNITYQKEIKRILN